MEHKQRTNLQKKQAGTMRGRQKDIKKGQADRIALRANGPLLPSGPHGVGLVAAARDLTCIVEMNCLKRA